MNYSMKVLTDEDVRILGKRERNYWVTLSFIIVVISVLCFYVIPANDGWDVALYVGSFLAIVVIIVAVLFYRLAAKTRLDKSEAIKICGEFVVHKIEKKGEYSSQWFLIVRTRDKQYDLFIKENVYKQIVPTDVMYVEFTPHSQTLLCLRKGNVLISLT